MKWAWIIAGGVLTGLAILGAILPLMPSTVFAIGAAGCFAHASPRLERWLLRQPGIGPSVIAWRQERAIPRGAKCLALTGMTLSGLAIAWRAPLPVALVAGAVLLASALYVGTRPAPTHPA